MELKKEADSIGSKLLLFYIPPSASIYPEEWEGTIKKYRISRHDFSIEQPGIEFEAICKQNNLDCINPTRIFKKKAKKLKNTWKRLYFARDSHWNTNGNKLVGELLAEYIETNYCKSKVTVKNTKK